MCSVTLAYVTSVGSHLLGKLQVKRKKGEENTEGEEEETAVSIVSSLMQNLQRGSRRDRVAAKFVEDECEKCDRLMELFNRYFQRLLAEQVGCLASKQTDIYTRRAWVGSKCPGHCW